MSQKEGFGCLELCLYGIRELVSATSWSSIWIWDLEWSTLPDGAPGHSPASWSSPSWRCQAAAGKIKITNLFLIIILFYKQFSVCLALARLSKLQSNLGWRSSGCQAVSQHLLLSEHEGPPVRIDVRYLGEVLAITSFTSSQYKHHSFYKVSPGNPYYFPVQVSTHCAALYIYKRSTRFTRFM